MKCPPAGFDDSDLVRELAHGWDIRVDKAEYAAVGFGSHHWIVISDLQQRFFVTVDDLGEKPWLGDTHDLTFTGLRNSFDMALALRDQAALEFVLAPLPSVGGESVRRVGERHSIAVFPFVDGDGGGFGDDTTAEHRADVIRMLAELHRSTPRLPRPAPPRPLGFAGRPGLEGALRDLDGTWHGGAFAEPARALLASRAAKLRERLDSFDQVVRAVSAAQGTPVITHGEPHPGNVMRSNGKLLLIDWDTVALAPPERDLWLVATDSGEEVALYEEATGRRVDGAALALYRQAWELADVAAYLHEFRSPHDQTADTEDAWTYLTLALGD